MTTRIKSAVKRLWRGQEGAAFTEYGLLLLLVVIAIAVGGVTLGDNITAFLNNVGAFFTGAQVPAAPGT
jgi:Flp pilus assembly pilin Flp